MPNRLPSLNSLRVFDAVARRVTMSAAAAELGVTHGAVSRQVKNLEETLGIRLLEVNGRGVQLTAAGERLSAGLRRGFAHIMEALEDSRRSLLNDRITVLVGPIFATTWLVPRLDRFHRQMPEIDVVLRDKLGEDDAPAAGDDVVIDWRCRVDVADCVADKLVDEEIFPVCGPRLGRQIAREGSLAGVTLLHPESVSRSWEWPEWPAFLAAVGREAETDGSKGCRLSGALIVEALRADKGLALACTSFAHDDLASGRLVRPIAESTATECGYWLLAPKARLERPAVAAFRSWLLEEAAACFGAAPTTHAGDRESLHIDVPLMESTPPPPRCLTQAAQGIGPPLDWPITAGAEGRTAQEHGRGSVASGVR